MFFQSFFFSFLLLSPKGFLSIQISSSLALPSDANLAPCVHIENVDCSHSAAGIPPKDWILGLDGTLESCEMLQQPRK